MELLTVSAPRVKSHANYVIARMKTENGLEEGVDFLFASFFLALDDLVGLVFLELELLLGLDLLELEEVEHLLL